MCVLNKKEKYSRRKKKPTRKLMKVYCPGQSGILSVVKLYVACTWKGACLGSFYYINFILWPAYSTILSWWFAQNLDRCFFFGWIQKKAKSNKHTKTKSTMKPIIENMWKTTLNLVDSEHIVLSRELPLIRCSKCLCMYNIRLQNTQIDAYRWYLTDRLMTIFWDLWNLMIKSWHAN